VRVGDDGVLAEPSELATVTTPEPGWQVDFRSCSPEGDQRIVIVSIADETFVVFRGPGAATTTVHSGEMSGVYRLRACSRGRVVLDGFKPMECTPKGCLLRDAFEVNWPARPPIDHNFAAQKHC